MIFPSEIQTIISSYKIGGFIPLDKTLHFLVGMTITIIFRLRKVKISKIIIFLCVIETLKEINDSYTLNSSLLEESLDFFWTISYPLTLYFIIKWKEKILLKLEKSNELNSNNQD